MAFARHMAACCTGLLLLALASAAFAKARPAPGKEAAAGKLLVYVGTYTNSRKSKGIYRLELDLASGKLTSPVLAAETTDPSFLAIHPGRRFLYAVGESGSFRGKKSGVVSAFAIDPKTGDLTLLNNQASEGAGPCHLVVDGAGKHVLAANYGGGSACVVPIEDDGRLGKATAFVQHKGSSVNPDRQKEPHAHSINLDPANRFAFVADLGLDKVLVYRFDKASGTLTPNDPPAAALAPGAGPRHFAFHPTGRHAYVINELDSTVTAFDYDAQRGVLKPVQTVTALPKGFKGKSWTAEVVVHPSGKFVYGSNRGHDSIAVFSVDAKTGQLTPAGHQSDRIKTPRNFAIDPTGAWLLVANQASDSVIVFRIDPDTGRLEPTGHAAEVPVPVCVRMMPWPR
jgi:6-phosphogluconolactonase